VDIQDSLEKTLDEADRDENLSHLVSINSKFHPQNLPVNIKDDECNYELRELNGDHLNQFEDLMKTDMNLKNIHTSLRAKIG
jgi:hypothetical protein